MLFGYFFVSLDFMFFTVHDVQPFASSEFNMTHIIRHLSFGLNVEGKSNPMDNTTVVADEGKRQLIFCFLF